MLSIENFYVIDGVALAFIAGLFSSPHCVGMCGPLGCSLFFSCAGSGKDAQLSTLAYHGVRSLGYCILGAVLGWFGSYPLKMLSSEPVKVALVLLVLVLFGMYAHPKMAAGWRRLYYRFVQRLKRFPRGVSGILLGLVTPLLPCGPLYLIFLVCALSGSAIKGAEIGLGFALGTVPLLWLAQSQYLRLYPKLNRPSLRWLQHSMTLGSVAIVVWRVAMTASSNDTLFCHP